MDSAGIASVVAKVLYLSGPDVVDPRKSLFHDYGLSSLDFVDLAFEVRSASAKQFQPEALWPINAMMTNREYYSGGRWTNLGRQELAEVFQGHAELPEEPSTKDIHSLFTVAFIEHRLRSL